VVLDNLDITFPKVVPAVSDDNKRVSLIDEAHLDASFKAGQ